MGMVAGVFLRFGLDMVFAFRDDLWIRHADGRGLPRPGAFPRIARAVPPLIGALLIGVIAVGCWGVSRRDPRL